jgi:serine/threonine protein kinase
VEKLEPLILRKEWMNNLAQAVAFLESLNLAHGDLRPENILLDRDRLKLSDFDNTAELGTDFETCMAPYGRILNADEADQGPPGSSGCLGPRTEQFALGSIFYLINYGFEVYGNQSLGDNPRDHGPKVVDLLQNKQFPNLDGDSMIDNIISKCWHNKYATIAELATEMKTVVPERDTASNTDNKTTSVNEAAIQALTSGGDTDDRDTSCSADEFLSKKAFCEDLKKRGLLHMLSSEKPEQLGFTLEWYRYQKQELDSK